MAVYNVPLSTDDYPALIARCLQDIYTESGDVSLSLVYREHHSGRMPVLYLDFYTPSGKLFTHQLNLPPDTPGRTESRTDTLLELLELAGKIDLRCVGFPLLKMAENRE